MYSSEVIAGGAPGDVMLARHVRLTGTQREIGHDIADIAWSDHGVRPQPSLDPTLTRARRCWRRAHWPELEERAAGAADRWGLTPGDDAYETASLFVSGLASACSVVWLPADRMAGGAPLMSRNVDFPLGLSSSWAPPRLPARRRSAAALIVAT